MANTQIDIKVHDVLTKYVYEAIETAHIEHDTKMVIQAFREMIWSGITINPL